MIIISFSYCGFTEVHNWQRCSYKQQFVRGILVLSIYSLLHVNKCVGILTLRLSASLVVSAQRTREHIWVGDNVHIMFLADCNSDGVIFDRFLYTKLPFPPLFSCKIDMGLQVLVTLIERNQIAERYRSGSFLVCYGAWIYYFLTWVNLNHDKLRSKRFVSPYQD